MEGELVVGTKYRVTYSLTGRDRQQMFVGTYMGWHKTQVKFQFDLGPKFGMVLIARSSVVSVEVVDAEIAHSRPS